MTSIIVRGFSLICLVSSSSGSSVRIDCPAISTAWPSRPCLRTKSSDATMQHAAPSDVGEHCSLVSGSYTMGDLSTSSSVAGSRNCEYGLLTEWRCDFSPIMAKCLGVHCGSSSASAR